VNGDNAFTWIAVPEGRGLAGGKALSLFPQGGETIKAVAVPVMASICRVGGSG
jgi:hypothetical protein